MLTAANAGFDNKNVGTGKTVTDGHPLSGADAGNYTVNATATRPGGHHGQAADLGTTAASNKVYDGNTADGRTGGPLPV